MSPLSTYGEVRIAFALPLRKHTCWPVRPRHVPCACEQELSPKTGIYVCAWAVCPVPPGGRKDKMRMASCTNRQTQLAATAYLQCSWLHVWRAEIMHSMTQAATKHTPMPKSAARRWWAMLILAPACPRVGNQTPNGVHQENH